MTADYKTAMECLRQINPSMLEYNDWLATGMALKDAGGTAAEWDSWSQRDAKRYRKSECTKKWAGFNGDGIGLGTLVKLCRDHGGTPPKVESRAIEDRELAWDAEIGRDAEDDIPSIPIREPEELAMPVNWNGLDDFRRYISALFSSEEHVGYVTEAWMSEADGDGKRKWLPKKGAWDRTAGQLLELATTASDLGSVIGDWTEEAGAWIRFNPLDGAGVKDENVTSFRFALVESDDVSIEQQAAIYSSLELPVAALVHSGGKSLHAIVRIDAPDAKEYSKRVDFLYDVCRKHGLVVDRKNRNPSRLSRLPGATRNSNQQRLVAVNQGKATWQEWYDWVAAINDDLPDVECLADHFANLPPLADVLIEGILRKGHKLLLTGPANAGKSLSLIRLAVAVAEGQKWFNRQCAQGRVLYVNLEVDRASCLHRLAAIYQAWGIPPNHVGDIDVWNLRGHGQSLDRLAPRLIRRAAKGRYVAVIIDPIYKVLTGDENAAHEMSKFCNYFDQIARELGTSVIYCHHHSKGAQGGKFAADRASGSGVFKRDPDALLDLVELEIDEKRRDQLSNRWECEAMYQAFDFERPDWRSECPQDVQIVARDLARWAEGVGLGDQVRESRPAAVEAASRVTGWRLECGTVREFAQFNPIQVWFKYPLHLPDTYDLLMDAQADGEEPLKRKREEAIGDNQAMLDSELTLVFADLSKDGEEVTVKSMAEVLERTDETVRNRIKSAEKRGGNLRVRKGKVVKHEDTNE